MNRPPPPQSRSHSDGLPFVILVILGVFMLAVAGLGFLFSEFALPKILGGR